MLVLRTVDKTTVPSANPETIRDAALCVDGITGMIAAKLLIVLAIMAGTLSLNSAHGSCVLRIG